MLGILAMAARFDAGAYRTIAVRREYLAPALVAVGLAGVSHAVLGNAWATAGGWAPIRSIVPAALSQVVIWVVLSGAAWGLGRMGGSRLGSSGVFRAVGVAQLPAILYALGVFEPVLYVMGAGWIAATYLALRAALGLSPGSTAVVLVASFVFAYLAAGVVTLSVLGILE